MSGRGPDTGHSTGKPVEGLIVCATPSCSARFFLVPKRAHPRLCLGCSQDVELAGGGWTPESSVD